MLAQQYYSSLGYLAPRPMFVGDRLWLFNASGPPIQTQVPAQIPHGSQSVYDYMDVNRTKFQNYIQNDPQQNRNAAHYQNYPITDDHHE